MKALVTGAAGFIGSHLCELLIQEGYTVVGIDNYYSGRPENLKAVADHARFSFHECDIRDKDSLAPLFSNVEHVYHLAGLADIVPSIENPKEYFEVNVDGTFHVLECARSAHVKRFVYAASSSCYGIPQTYPTPETEALSPQYPYALTKLLGEQLVMHWESVYQLPALSLRLFNVYGPRSRTSGTYGAVFGVFLAQKLHKKPFTVVGEGTQTRDFTYVKDVARAFLAAGKSSVSGEILNVGSGNHYSVNRLVELLGGDVVHIPKRPGEPDCTFADTTKIHQLLGWEAAVSFEEGVAKLLESIHDYDNAPLWDPQTIEKATQSWFKHLSKEAPCSSTV